MLCGVVRCGVVWCGAVWCGVVWCGVVWCDVMWCDVMWSKVSPWESLWCEFMCCHVMCCYIMLCECVWCDMMYTSMTCYDGFTWHVSCYPHRSWLGPSGQTSPPFWNQTSTRIKEWNRRSWAKGLMNSCAACSYIHNMTSISLYMFTICAYTCNVCMHVCVYIYIYI